MKFSGFWSVSARYVIGCGLRNPAGVLDRGIFPPLRFILPVPVDCAYASASRTRLASTRFARAKSVWSWAVFFSALGTHLAVTEEVLYDMKGVLDLGPHLGFELLDPADQFFDLPFRHRF